MSTKKVTLKSSDGEAFEVEETIILQSQTIKYMIENECADDGIPLPVTSKILAKVIEYCKQHAEGGQSAEEALKKWDVDFVKVDLATMYYLLLAANYLDIESLLDLTCQTGADMIKGKTRDEIRKIFNTVNQEEIRRENQWAFE